MPKIKTDPVSTKNGVYVSKLSPTASLTPNETGLCGFVRTREAIVGVETYDPYNMISMHLVHQGWHYRRVVEMSKPVVKEMLIKRLCDEFAASVLETLREAGCD